MHIAYIFLYCAVALFVIWNALQQFIYDSDEEEKNFGFCYNFGFFFCSFIRLLDAIVSRQFLNNETTVCQQRQQQKHTRTHTHCTKREKIRQNRNHKIDLQKSKAGRFISQDHQEIAKCVLFFVFFSSTTINRKDGKKRYSQWQNKSARWMDLFFSFFFWCQNEFRSLFFLFLSLLLRDYGSGKQIMEFPELKWFSAFRTTFFFIISRFYLIIQMFYHPPSSPCTCHTQRSNDVFCWSTI